MKDKTLPTQALLPQPPRAVLGLDIAKGSFEAVLLFDEQTATKSFRNAQPGFLALAQWLAKHLSKDEVQHVHACMEATGPYFEGLARFLLEHEHTVSVVNPRRIKAYGQSKLLRTKTDRVDARLIADFCATQGPLPWQPPRPEQRKLQALTRHLDALKRARIQHENQLEMLGGELLSSCEEVRGSLATIIAVLQEQITEIERQLKAHVRSTPSLKQAVGLLSSIPGIGTLSAAQILSEAPDLSQFASARAVAAYAGLVPSERQSGTSVRGRARLSKLGNARLRKALYMPALSARKWNPLVRALKERLERRGKRPKQVIVACMRKLLHLCYGVLKTGKPFDPNYALSP